MSPHTHRARVTNFLERAASELPTSATRVDDERDSPSFQDYLDVNELELALDAIVDIGDSTSCGPSFWRLLTTAAREMSLQRQRDYCMDRLTGSLGIIQESTPGFVSIGQLQFAGHIDQSRRCPHCDRIRLYFDRFDAYFCPLCDTWLEASCSDPSCDYCRSRPSTPMSAISRP
jgi:hypothetical protein